MFTFRRNGVKRERIYVAMKGLIYGHGHERAFDLIDHDPSRGARDLHYSISTLLPTSSSAPFQREHDLTLIDVMTLFHTRSYCSQKSCLKTR